MPATSVEERSVRSFDTYCDVIARMADDPDATVSEYDRATVRAGMSAVQTGVIFAAGGPIGLSVDAAFLRGARAGVDVGTREAAR